MILKNDNIGLLVGTFFGALFGSGGTILVMHKLGKLEQKKDLEAENKRLEEIEQYYDKQLKELKNMKVEVEKACEDTKEEIKNNTEIIEDIANKATRPRLDVNVDEPEITNPKFLYQEELAKEYNESIPKDNHGNVSYNKLYTTASKKFDNLAKEYEREENKEELKFPVQITKSNYEHSGGYVKEELIYYEQNGIFTDLNDFVMDHYNESYFGLDNLIKFGSPEATIDGQNSLYELYLRDEEIHVDFHILYDGKTDFNTIEKAGNEK